jgi:hypothetical protein
LTVSGTRFRLDGKPFPYTGVSFFNAIYNEAFNRSSEDRRRWLQKFQKYGINVIRVWGQWDNKMGLVDTCPECSLYQASGELRPGPLDRLKQICADADTLGFVVELTLFSRETAREGGRLAPEAADRAVAAVTRELRPYRNLALQIWNEYDDRTVEQLPPSFEGYKRDHAELLVRYMFQFTPEEMGRLRAGNKTSSGAQTASLR